MNGQPIDLAERRRLRDAQRAAEAAAQEDAATQEHTAPSPPSSPGEEGWVEGVAPEPASSRPSARSAAYAELHCLSDFSFQRGASSAAELFDRARKLGYAALAITDECSLAGIVRAFVAARDIGLPLIVGSEFTLDDGLKLVVLVENQDGYSELCRLITDARRRSEKGEYRIGRADFRAGAPGLIALWLPTPGHPANDDEAAWIKATFPGGAWIAVELHRSADDTARLASCRSLGERHDLRLLAAGDVHMHVRRRRALQDVMTAIRVGTTVANAGAALFPNGERHLRRIEQLRAIYTEDLIAETLVVAARCRFQLDKIRYEYPHEVVPEGTDASTHLAELTWAGAAERWPQGYDEATRRQIELELALIKKLKYEHFFLTVHDIVRWARAQEPVILCQGRGSAANSAVCYCLGITSIDPVRGNLLFERFISEERDEPPDIDVDFEHERREEVIQYVFRKYGRHRAALAATVIMYRSRSAARDVGRALGLSDDQLNQLSDVYSYGHGDMIPLFQRLREAGFDPDSRLMRQIIVLVEELRGSPRHLSQHVGGFVISEHPLHTLVPVENATMAERTVIQWDKDDLESMRLLKVDCLALGMLTCLRKCFDLLREHTDLDYDLAKVPPEDPDTYAMIQKADTIGVFQIESRAQMSMLPRLRPANFYDLVIEIAIVRPGPIEGGMVHPFLRRRDGKEKVDYPRSTLPEYANDVEKQGRIEQILGRTWGVPIFQEQVMKLVQEVAGFTAGEADQLRRSMGSWRNDGQVEIFRERIYRGMRDRGYGDFADRLYSQIKGFGSYGFPESHSASFALLAYASSWLKCHQPAAFACALLNSLPMGFYPPAQIVQDVRRHGVEVRPPDVTASVWDCTLERVEDGFALRLGLRLVKGASEAMAGRIAAARAAKPFADIADTVRRAALSRLERDRLAEGGAFGRLAGHRHQARWESAGAERDLPVLAGASIREQRVALRAPSATQTVLADYRTLGLSLEQHPVGLIRDALEREHRRSSRVLATLVNGTPVRTAGLVTVRQRPPEAGGATFMTLEDEYGQINLVVWRDVAERYRRPLLESVLLGVDGELQQEKEVRHVIARRLYDLSHWLPSLAARSRDFH